MLLREHGGAIEADFHHEYHLDVCDLGTERLSWGKFASLVAHLPRSSRTLRALGGDTFAWGDLEHLLANLVDIGAQANWMYASVHREKNSAEPPRPPALRRPGMRDPSRRGSASLPMADVRRLIANARPRKR